VRSSTGVTSGAAWGSGPVVGPSSMTETAGRSVPPLPSFDADGGRLAVEVRPAAGGRGAPELPLRRRVAVDSAGVSPGAAAGRRPRVDSRVADVRVAGRPPVGFAASALAAAASAGLA